MGKQRRKNSKEVEYLKGEVRRLRQQIKVLLKTKGLPPPSEKDIPLDELPLQLTPCIECGKGVINLVLSLDRMNIFECNICDARKTVKK